MIGLPGKISACLFDLDGVLTGTAALHKEAWKQTFDSFLRERDGSGYRSFTDHDYAEFVDGRPRLDGVRGFLASRRISLPEGGAPDRVTDHTVHGLANRKNELVLAIIDQRGVDPYQGSARYLEAVARAGLGIAVVTSSANAAAVLKAANLEKFAHVLIDGLVIARENLHGKPAPDSFLAAAKALDTAPENAAVFEDALAGVAAGKAGGFGYVVGVDRENQAGELREHGADVVVRDLAELLADERSAES
jgi:beta-phosphoglucomutase family hydrolase